MQLFGDRKSLSIAKNHPKPSQEVFEQFGPSIHKMKGLSRNSPQKVHPNFAQNLGRQILGNTFSGLKRSFLQIPDSEAAARFRPSNGRSSTGRTPICEFLWCLCFEENLQGRGCFQASSWWLPRKIPGKSREKQRNTLRPETLTYRLYIFKIILLIGLPQMGV